MENETPTENTATTKAPQYVSVKVLYQAVIFVSLAISVLSLVIYDRYFTIKLATFDLLGYSKLLEEARAANKITNDEADKMLKTVRQQIDALPPKYVVISGDAILGNAPKVEKLNIR